MRPGAKGAHSHRDGLHTRSYPADCEGWKSDERGGGEALAIGAFIARGDRGSWQAHASASMADVEAVL
jgi:hypothetical protein